MILSKKGLLALAGDGAGNENVSALYAAAVARETIGLFDLAHHTKLAFALTNPAVEFRTYFNVLPNPDPDAAEHGSLTVGANFQNSDAEADLAPPKSGLPFQIDTLLAPVVFASYAYNHKQDAHFSFSNGLMTLTDKGYHLTTEEHSGKPVELNADGDSMFRVSSQSHAFDGALAQILQA